MTEKNSFIAEINREIDEVNQLKKKSFLEIARESIKWYHFGYAFLVIFLALTSFKNHPFNEAFFLSIGWIVAMISYLAILVISNAAHFFNDLNTRYQSIVEKSITITNTVMGKLDEKERNSKKIFAKEKPKEETIH